MNSDSYPFLSDRIKEICYLLTGFPRKSKVTKNRYREYLVKPLPNGIAFYFRSHGMSMIEDWPEAEEVHEICLIAGKTRITYRGLRGMRWRWCADFAAKEDIGD